MRLSESTEDGIVQYYLDGNNVSKTSENFKVGKDIIKRVLNKYDIQIIQHPIRNKYNTRFFSDYTSQSCYWAGFIAADGNIHSKRDRLTINLSIKDVEHLRKFTRQINYEGSIHYTEASQTHGPTCRVDLGGAAIVADLSKNFGITPNKTLSISIPEQMPIEMYPHFLRGYSDGDGCISLKHNKSNNQYTYSFSIVSGSDVLINQWRDYFYNRGIRTQKRKSGDEKPTIITKNNCKTIHYNSYNAMAVLNILYKDSNDDIRLDRKYNKYQDLLEFYDCKDSTK